MNYPLISEYVEAVRNAADNFDTLSHLQPVLDNDGNPVMSSGNFAVVFKIPSLTLLEVQNRRKALWVSG